MKQNKLSQSTDSRIDATVPSAVARTHVATKSAAQGTDDAADSATANFAVGDQSLPLGWTLLGAASAKLWSTLKCLAQKGRRTKAEHLAKVSGLSERTIPMALEELRVLGLLSYNGKRGEGYEWEFQTSPSRFPIEATQFYQEKIDKKNERIRNRIDKLDQASGRLAEIASGWENGLFQNFASRAKEDPQDNEKEAEKREEEVIDQVHD